MTDTALTLEALIGENVRRLREAAGVRRDQLAAAAKRAGLTWSYSSVVVLEEGRRGVSAAELLLLPTVLADAANDRKTVIGLDEFFRTSATEVRLTPTFKVTTRRLRRYIPQSGRLVATAGSEPELEMVGPRMNRFHHLLPDVGLRRLLELMQRGTDDATVKAAKRIGVTPEEVVLASHRLWRHGLTEEREARTAAEAAADATPRTLQGVRGAVTRGLIIELQRLFFNVEQWEEQHPEAEEEAREWQRAEMFGAARGAIKSSRETIKESTNAAHC